MKNPRPLNIEGLEARDVPATWGNPWPDAQHLTISFAPDGADIGGQKSELNKALDRVAPRAVWQQEVLRAFQAWAAQAGVNFGVVADGGQAFGTPGRPQGDARFGDIRIGAGHYGDSVIAFSSPFDITAGTWSGDLRLNLDRLPSIGGQGGPDLYTAVLQEAGHVLGIGNSTDSNSVMFEEYLGPRQGLSAGDVASAQALYGGRPGDSFEGTTGNETLATATRLGWLSNSGGVLSILAAGDLSRPGDVDVYRFTAPSVTGAFSLTLQRDGLSLLTPKVTLYDSQGRLVDTVSSADPDGGDLELRVSKLAPLATYYVKVEAAGAGFGVGSYKLRAESIPLVNNLVGGLLSAAQNLGQALTNNDLHTNDSLFTASNLLGNLFRPESRFDVAYQASISDRWDVDYYKVVAPTGAPGVLQVMAWGTGNSQVRPHVTLLDGQGRQLAAEVLTAEGDVVALQFVGVKAGATYYVRVDGGGTTGNYFLGADFRATPTRMETLAEGQLAGSKSGVLDIQRAGLMHFVVEADRDDGTGVRLDVIDSAGRVVGSASASAGEAASVNVALDAGRYTVRLTAFRADGKPAGAVNFGLKGMFLTDPIGPRAEDPTGSPSRQPPPPPPPPPDNSTTTTSSGGSTTTTRTEPDGSTTTTTTSSDGTTTTTRTAPDGSSTTTTTARDGTTTTTSQPPPPPDNQQWYSWTWSDPPPSQTGGGSVQAEEPSSGGYTTTSR